MRFHIGFSKRIKVKTLIQILGFLFVGLMAFFGFTQHGFAWTTFNQSDNNSTSVKSLFYGYYSQGYNFYSNSDGDIVDYNCDFTNNIYCGISFNTSNSSYIRYFSSFSSGESNVKQYLTSTFNSAIHTGFPSNSNLAPTQRGTTHYYELYLKNENNYCRSDSSNKSINIKGTFTIANNSSANISDFNNGYSLANIITTKINAYDDTNDRVYITSCDTTYEKSNSSYYYYTYDCSNVYIGDSNTTINKFGINFINNIPFEDMYKGSGTTALHYSFLFLASKSATMYDLPSLSYECSTDNPIVDNQPSYEDSLKNVADDLKNNYDTTIPGIDTSQFAIEYPQNIQELISLPIYLIQNVLDNGNTCTPYELDLTSLTSLGNNTRETKINIPCMRSKLSQLLGNIYSLIDILMAAFVFYYIGLHILDLLDAITSGVDLWTYYFSSTQDGLKFRSWWRGD